MGGIPNGPTFMIGDLARRLGLNVRTLRYYEGIGLLPEAARTEGNYRLYTQADEQRLRFIRQAKRGGFSLEEIGEILRRGRSGGTCDFVRVTLSRHLAALGAKIRDLENMQGKMLSLQAMRSTPAGEDAGADGGWYCALIERWESPSPGPAEKGHSAVEKRKVEVFTAGCPLCDPAVETVRRVVCTGCEVTVHDMTGGAQAADRAKAAGVTRVPMVLVDGKPALCCASGPVTEEGLRAARVGAE